MANSSRRVTVPTGHTPIIVTDELARALLSLIQLHRRKLGMKMSKLSVLDERRGRIKAERDVLNDFLLALVDGMENL